GIGLLAGRHLLKIEMDGYQPVTEEITAAGGQRLDRAVRLVATRRALEFITVPDGVKVSIDGAAAGTTSGPATPEVAALAAQVPFDAARASAPLLTPMVAPGEHRVTFERDCYGTKTMAVKVELDPENRPLRFSPVTLDESKSDLRLDSTPSGAEVFIDGARAGTTPLSVPGMCGGERDILVVKGEIGRWTERVRLTPGQSNTLSVRLRPTLLYAGTFRLDEWGRAVWSDEDKPLLDLLGRGLKTLNLVRDPRAQEPIRDAIVRYLIADPREARAGTLVPPDLLKEAAEKTGADLVLAGLSAAGDPEHTLTYALYSVLHPSADRVRLRIDRDAEVRDFVARLDSAPAAASTFWGLGLADTALPPAGAPVVARVLAGSPAAQAGIAPGDRVLQVGDLRASGTKDVLAAMETASSKSGGVRAPVVLTVGGGKGSRTVRIAPADAPALLALSEPGRLYNRALAEYRLRARAADDDRARGVANLNVGLAFMHFRAWDRASVDGLTRADLPDGAGLGQGTVLYYQGLCALRRGDPEAARAAFQKASTRLGATIESADGPSAAAAAGRALQALQ
ncbi:MAG TPA: PEGA domain-containing protein, partial [Dongiaceae bacterium]|nr:PEGA domain-containing protein [Dongiaceae bacterium]